MKNYVQKLYKRNILQYLKARVGFLLGGGKGGLKGITRKSFCSQDQKCLLAPKGVLAPGSAHARPSAQPPIDLSEEFPPHVSAESPLNISTNPSEVISKVSEP